METGKAKGAPIPCPGESEWVSVAGGSASPAESGRLLEHAAGCQRCAACLRSALAILSAEPDPDEDAMLATLESSRSDWQRRTAASLGARTKIEPARRWPVPLWAATAAAVILIAGVAVFVLAHRPPDTGNLLAQAFTAMRPFEYWLPDDGYNPVKQTRGSAAAIPAAPLLSAEIQIKDKLNRNPDDPKALEWNGTALLLDGKYPAAIDSLSRAHDALPQDSGILLKLATAYAVRGDAEGHTMDYGHALELYLELQKTTPRDPRVLFNLALVYQRLSMYDEALATWHELVARNPPAGWRQEAAAHIQEIEKIQQEKKKAQDRVIHQPAAFLAARHAKNDFDSLEYYEVFWAEWLPQSASSPASYQAAGLVASQMQQRFGDSSLADTLAACKRRGAAQALNLLARAISQNREGHAADATTTARDAEIALESTGLRDAAARARIELAYALRWAVNYPECLALTSRVIRETPVSQRWLLGNAHLEHSSCATALGRSGQARAEIEETYKDLSHAHIWPVALRAAGFLTGFDGYTGNYAAVWDNAAKGLQQYWTSYASSLRAQNFQFDLETAATLAGWRETAIVFYRAAIRSAHTAGNVEMEIYDRFDLAGLLRETGDTPGQVRELNLADSLLDAIERAQRPQNAVVEQLRSDALLRDAEAWVAAKDFQRALRDVASLNSLAAPLALADQTRLLQARGLAFAGLSKLQQAKRDLRAAVALNQKRALQVSSWLRRMPILDATASSYRMLTQIELDDDRDPATALNTWRSYRPDSDPNKGVTLTLALLPRGIAIWKSEGGRTTVRWAGAPVDAVRRACERFERLTASPDSNEEEIRHIGAQLFDWLIGPETQDAPPGVIRINADSWLAALPFGALTDHSGNYALRNWGFVGTYAPPRPPEPEKPVMAHDENALILAAPVATAPDHSELPFLPAADREAAAVAGHFRQAVLLKPAAVDTLWPQISRADVFHFVGHGWANSGGGALLIGAGPEGRSDFLTSNDLAAHDWSRCRLAVLSACLTATGAERGAVNNLSLVEALLSAGAQRVVAARWSVDSEATRALMTGFYNRLEHGLPAPESLARSALDVSKVPEWKHPFYWAAFEVFGRA